METVSGSSPLDNIRWQQDTSTPEADENRGMLTVSYTHLTLPTKRIV